jgi:hypothetical protein
VVKRASKQAGVARASAAKRARTRIRTLHSVDSEKPDFLVPVATPQPRVHRVSGMQAPRQMAGWLRELVATRRSASKKQKNWIVCLLCGETVRGGELLAHKLALHDAGTGSAKTVRRKKKGLRAAFVSGGLPTLGKRR